MTNQSIPAEILEYLTRQFNQAAGNQEVKAIKECPWGMIIEFESISYSLTFQHYNPNKWKEEPEEF